MLFEDKNRIFVCRIPDFARLVRLRLGQDRQDWSFSEPI